MTHITALQFSMHADGALSGDELAAVESHAESCDECGLRLGAYLKESQSISTSLRSETLLDADAAALGFSRGASGGPSRKFKKPFGLREFAIANVATGLLVWFAQFIWKTLFGELLVNAFSWFVLPLPDAYELLVDGALFYLQEGKTMIDAYIWFIAIAPLAALLTWFALSRGRARAKLAVCALALCGGALLGPTPALALEFKRDEAMVSIPAGDTIDDTLIAAGETVIVDGDVTGDLVAFARRIVVNGSVGGNLVTFAESITVKGKVGGTGIAAGSKVELQEASIAGDFWGAGQFVTIGGEAGVTGNATLMTEIATLEGEVGRDLMAVAETAEVTGSVTRNLHALTARLSLLGDAYVGGDITFHGDEQSLQRSDTAQVAGEIELATLPKRFQKRNRYLSSEHYLWQLFRLVSAFIAGAIILWLLPGLRDVTLNTAVGSLKTAGIGLVTLVSSPIIMLLLAITVIGIPVAAIGIVAWLLLIYAAKIVLASFLGQLVFAGSAYEDNMLMTLFVGLLVVIVAVNIPVIGGVISFIFLIVGIGLIVQALLNRAL